MIITDLFELHKGKSYFKEFEISKNSNINYITTSGENNGIKCQVNENNKYTIFDAGTITVAMQGSVLSSFVQFKPFYLQTHVAALVPKQDLTIREKIFYCLAIQSHAKKFSFGRKANKTIEELEIPSLDEIPDWVYTMEIPSFDDISETKMQDKVELPPVSRWKDFKYPEIFNLVKGRGPSATEAKHEPGNVPYVGASAMNNGITIYSNHKPEHKGNCITIATDGSVGEAFYQSSDFNATSNIAVITIKNRDLTPSLAMFLITIIRQEQEKFNYGRKWGLNRMKESTISLPVTEQGEPDWDLMERYINSLPYSKYL